MKKINITAMATLALAMLATSCSSDVAGLDSSNPASNGDKVAMTFNATQEFGSVSRAAISTDATKINWQSTDKVTIWDGTLKNEFSVQPTENNQTTATLNGTVNYGSTSFVAVYPNSVGQNCTFTTDAIEGLVIPATQTATEGTFDPAAAVMAAAYDASTNSFAFKNVFALLKITPSADYTKIVVTTNEKASIAGTFKVTNYGSTPTLEATSGTNAVTLSGEIKADKDYYIVIAPCIDVKELAIDCYTSDNKVFEQTQCFTAAKTYSRSGTYDAGNTSQYKALCADILPEWFSVSDEKLVHFTKSNVYWNGSAFKFEDNQTATPSTWDASHIGHFFWSKSKDVMIGTSYSDPSAAAADAFFFSEANKFNTENKVNGSSGYYALTKAEWEYLLNTSNATSGARTNANRFAKANTNNKNGLLVFPDGYNGVTTGDGIAAMNTQKCYFPSTSIPSETWTTMEAAGVVFLPVTKVRNGNTNLYEGIPNQTGNYWSATPRDITYSYEMCFSCAEYTYSNYVTLQALSRQWGYSLRLVYSLGGSQIVNKYGDGGTLSAWE